MILDSAQTSPSVRCIADDCDDAHDLSPLSTESSLVQVDDLWHGRTRQRRTRHTPSRLVLYADRQSIRYSDENGSEHTCLRDSFVQWTRNAKLMARAKR